MENRNIIIILIVIIVVLTAAIGFTLLNPLHAKEPTKIKITSNKTLSEGNNLSLQLTDSNNTALSKQNVNVTVKDSNGKVVSKKEVKTDDNGKAKLDLGLKKGNYNVTVSYGGNEKYIGSNATQKLTIEEKVTQAISSQPTSSDSSSKTSQREEYKTTPDGWNPGEHEVSRQSIGNGNERVSYDDGYFRVVDKDGDIITYGWG